jgi:hypothetical protein
MSKSESPAKTPPRGKARDQIVAAAVKAFAQRGFKPRALGASHSARKQIKGSSPITSQPRSSDEGNLSNSRTRWLVDTHLKLRFKLIREAGLAHTLAIDEDAIPHAFFALSGAAGLIFAVSANSRRLTGLNPNKSEAIEAHANFVAKLFVP